MSFCQDSPARIVYFAIFVHFRKYNMSALIAFRLHADKGHG